MYSFIQEIRSLHRGVKVIQILLSWFGRIFILSGILIIFSERYSPVGLSFIFVGILLNLSIFKQVYSKNYRRVLREIKKLKSKK